MMQVQSLSEDMAMLKRAVWTNGFCNDTIALWDLRHLAFRGMSVEMTSPPGFTNTSPPTAIAALLGGREWPVQYRHTNAPGGDAPLPVDWDQAVNTAAVVLMDNTLAHDQSWVRYVQSLVREATSQDYGARVFPVAIEAGGLDVLPGNTGRCAGMAGPETARSAKGA